MNVFVGVEVVVFVNVKVGVLVAVGRFKQESLPPATFQILADAPVLG